MSSRKTIGIVANTSWNIYNFRQNIIRKLISEGYDVIVFSPVDEYIQYKKNFPTVQHETLRHLSRDSMNPLRELKFALELWIKYRRYKCDFMIHYTVKPNIYGAIAAKLNGIKSIGVVTGLGFAFIHGGFAKTATKWLYKLTSRFHKKVIFENIEDRELFENEGLIKKGQGISVKGCGVDSDWYRPMPNGIYPDKTIFTFIGRLLYDKGVTEFVQAAEMIRAKYDHAEFWLVGDLDDDNPASVKKDDLVKWVKSNHVVYHGSTKDVRDYIAHSDCIVLPSYREAIARSITEGMAMQRPVITTDTAGCREAVEEGKNGYLVPIKDSTALAGAMEKFINLDDSSREAMGAYGRKKVLSEFDDRIIANEIVGIVKELI